MLESILTFLAANKTIIVGATATLAEVGTIIINFVRKNKAEKQMVQTMSEAGMTDVPKASVGKKLLWAANPINLFRKPK